MILPHVARSKVAVVLPHYRCRGDGRDGRGWIRRDGVTTKKGRGGVCFVLRILLYLTVIRFNNQKRKKEKASMKKERKADGLNRTNTLQLLSWHRDMHALLRSNAAG